MSLFYTNVQSVGNNILYRGVTDGKRTKIKIPYQPTLYEHSKKVTNYTSLDGHYLQGNKFDSMRDARDYLKQFEGVSGKKIYGQNRFEYAFIGEQHKDQQHTAYTNHMEDECATGGDSRKRWRGKGKASVVGRKNTPFPAPKPHERQPGPGPATRQGGEPCLGDGKPLWLL